MKRVLLFIIPIFLVCGCGKKKMFFHDLDWYIMEKNDSRLIKKYNIKSEIDINKIRISEIIHEESDKTYAYSSSDIIEFDFLKKDEVLIKYFTPDFRYTYDDNYIYLTIEDRFLREFYSMLELSLFLSDGNNNYYEQAYIIGPSDYDLKLQRRDLSGMEIEDIKIHYVSR